MNILTQIGAYDALGKKYIPCLGVELLWGVSEDYVTTWRVKKDDSQWEWSLNHFFKAGVEEKITVVRHGMGSAWDCTTYYPEKGVRDDLVGAGMPIIYA